MNKFIVMFTVLLSNFCIAYPMEDIYKNLDISTFSSSFARKTSNDKSRFVDLISLPKPIIKDSEIIMENDSWVYKIIALKENSGGIHICFIDHAKQGSYDAQKPMVIRKYGDQYVALLLRSNVCENFVR